MAALGLLLREPRWGECVTLIQVPVEPAHTRRIPSVVLALRVLNVFRVSGVVRSADAIHRDERDGFHQVGPMEQHPAGHVP